MSSRREKRHHAKLAKIKAELMLLQCRQMDALNPSESSSETTKDSLKTACEAIQKIKAADPSNLKLHLCLHKLQSPNRGLNGIFGATRSASLQPFDIQSLMMYVTVGPQSGFKPRWCKLKPWRQISQCILITVGASKDTFIRHGTCFPYLKKYFSSDIADICPVGHLDTALFRLPVTAHQLLKEQVAAGSGTELPNGFTLINAIDKPTIPSESYVSRMQLLMSMLDLVALQYPLPSDIDCDGFMFSKESYTKVTPQSPIFAIDCEMCLTTNGQDYDSHELTRFSMVDEDLRIICDTLVKPDNPVSDYLTKYSGISEGMLDSVEVRLGHIQRFLRDFLPPDAILCGHSMNFDLKALRLFHPYVIDLGNVYNLSGEPNLKSSLQTLAYTFLGESIQNSAKGHCSIEDAVATMKLVKLKMEKGLSFGNVSLGWSYHAYTVSADSAARKRKPTDNAADNTVIKVAKMSPKPIVCQFCTAPFKLCCENGDCSCRHMCHRYCYKCFQTVHNSWNPIDLIPNSEIFKIPSGKTKDLFAYLKEANKKLLLVSGECDEAGKFCSLAKPNHFHVGENEARLTTFCERLFEFDLAVLKLDISGSSACREMNEVDQIVQRAFQAAPLRALVTVLFHDIESQGCFMLKLKKSV